MSGLPSAQKVLIQRAKTVTEIITTADYPETQKTKSNQPHIKNLIL